MASGLQIPRLSHLMIYDFSCHDGDDEIPEAVPQYGDDWDDTQVVEDDCV